jgi:TorA maturation chaperone TorD
MMESVDLMHGRVAFYKFFSAIFKAPLRASDLTHVIASIEYLDAFAKESEIDKLKSSSKLLCAFAEKTTKLTGNKVDKILADLSAGYSALFTPAPSSLRTIESTFAAKTGFGRTDAPTHLSAIYEQNGFKTPANFEDAKDHVAIELLFMAHMADLTAKSVDGEAYDKCITTELAFLQEHLLMWVPEFCDRLISRAICADKHRFYESITIFLKEYLAYDSSMLENFTED